MNRKIQFSNRFCGLCGFKFRRYERADYTLRVRLAHKKCFQKGAEYVWARAWARDEIG